MDANSDLTREGFTVAFRATNPRTRKSAAQNLESIEAAWAIELLSDALKNDPSAAVRVASAESLSRSHHPDAVLHLISALADDQSQVREEATRGLGRLGDKRAVGPLIASLQDKNSKVRMYAALNLGYLGDDSAIDPLIATLQRDRSYWARGFAALALGMVNGGRTTTRALLQAVEQDKNTLVKREATHALGKIQDQQVIPALKQLLKHGDSELRFWAAWGLGRMRQRIALRPLLTALQDRNQQRRYSAANVLGELGDVRAVPRLIQALEDPFGFVRCSAAEALGKLGDDRAVRPLTFQLSHHSANLRASAARALGQIGDSRAITALEQLLHDQRETRHLEIVGDVAAEAIAQITQTKAEYRD